MKKVLIDIYKANTPHSGLGQFSINFHNQLVEQAPQDLEIQFLHPGNFPAQRDIGFGYNKVSAARRYWPALSPKVDIWHSLHQFPSHLPRTGVKQLLTVHDLNFLTEKNELKRQKYLTRLQKNVNRADAINTISHYTKDVLHEHIELGGKEVKVIYNGVYLKEYPQASAPAYLNDQPFFFSLGIFNAKKNFEVLLPMMKHFPDHLLVIAGNHQTAYGQKVKAQIKEHGLDKQVKLTGAISDEEKFWLYSHCQALLFPSMAEGFGLPVIEAYSVGKPAFLSRMTSLPEIGGDLAHYWDHFDPEYMAEVVKSGLKSFEENPDSQIAALKKRASSFSWELCIENYLQLYRSL